MATGALLLPPGYHPLIDGAVVPSGKLHFYRTGTTTDQDTYTDSTLSVANANPVVLNANGGLDQLVYGNPASGYKYRMRVYSSADVLLDTHDDLLVWGADTANFTSGSFTGTLTGYASGPTGTVTYKITANSSGTGKLCTLNVAAAISGTSNATSLTMTGLPTACQPTTDVRVPCVVFDNGANYPGQATIVAAASTITFAMASPFNSAGFTGSGTKGLAIGWSITYPL